MTVPAPDGLTYDPDTDLWYGDDARVYVLCEENPGKPLYIDVSKPLWRVSFQGSDHTIVWDRLALNLPPQVIEQARQAVLVLIKKRTPGFLSNVRLALMALSTLDMPDFETWSDLSIRDWSRIWTELEGRHLYALRTLYRQIATNLSDEVLLHRVVHLDTFKVSGKGSLLEDVMLWDARRGALTPAELERTMRLLRIVPEDEADSEHALRLLAQLSFELGKRPVQILNVAADGLIVQDSKGVRQYFLRVPGAKGRRGTPPQLWEITPELGRDVERFSRRPAIARLQERFNLLFVLPGASLEKHGQTGSGNANSRLVHYFKKFHDRGLLLTERNGTVQPIHYSQYRGRHTHAAHLAMAGAPIEQIMFSLEHNSRHSAQAYIDAVGAMLVPAIDGVDRRLGNIFGQLNDTFFAGEIVEDVREQPIVIPDFTLAPTVVGSCGRNAVVEGACRKHPFFACLNGCPQFLAWRQVDCQVMLTWVEGELRRWTAAEGHPERSALLEEFERLYQAILDLKRRIEEKQA